MSLGGVRARSNSSGSEKSDASSVFDPHASLSYDLVDCYDSVLDMPVHHAEIHIDRRPPSVDSQLLSSEEIKSALKHVDLLRDQLIAQQSKLKYLYFRALGISPPEDQENLRLPVSTPITRLFHSMGLSLSSSERPDLQWYPDEMDEFILNLASRVRMRRAKIEHLEGLGPGAWKGREMKYPPADWGIHKTDDEARASDTKQPMTICEEHGYRHRRFRDRYTGAEIEDEGCALNAQMIRETFSNKMMAHRVYTSLKHMKRP